MHIAIVGTGYVGLVTGACLADLGHRVTCIDTDRHKIELLQAGRVPFHEPGLEALVARMRDLGRLHFAGALSGALEGVEAVFLAVGTPSRAADGRADLSFLYAAAKQAALALTGPALMVIKSTVPAGTGDEIERLVAATRPDLAIELVSNPEFLREGAAIDDFMRPDRIVVGAQSAHAHAHMAALYAPLVAKGAPLVETSRKSAEMIKYAANAFLAVKLTFINEIADLCERLGADVRDVSRGIGMDRRIGAGFLKPGPGYGGSCFPKDTQALIRAAHDYESPMRTVETIVAINEQRKRAMARKVVAACGGSVRGKTIGVLGLTFKPDTDDMRDAPSLTILRALLDFGAHVKAYDPMLAAIPDTLPDDVVARVASAEAAAQGADALVLITEWAEFGRLDWSLIARDMAEPLLIDLRNAIDPETTRRAGLRHIGIGLPTALQTVGSPRDANALPAHADAQSTADQTARQLS